MDGEDDSPPAVDGVDGGGNVVGDAYGGAALLASEARQMNPSPLHLLKGSSEEMVQVYSSKEQDSRA